MRTYLSVPCGGITMKSSQDYKQKVKWCLSKKDGIKLTEPSENLALDYEKKAKSALNIFESCLEKNELEWIAITGYFARYLTLYSIFAKCGIKSEIHDCTISLMKYGFVDGGIIEEKCFEELEEAKELRVKLQYYVAEHNSDEIREFSEKSREFVVKLNSVRNNMNKNDIKILRDKIMKIR